MAIPKNLYNATFHCTGRLWFFIFFTTDGWGLRFTVWCRFFGGFSIAWQTPEFMSDVYVTEFVVLHPGKLANGDPLPILERVAWRMYEPRPQGCL